jgi:hypothetical protein
MEMGRGEFRPEPTARRLGRLGRAQVEQTARRLARAVGAGRPAPLALEAIPLPDSAAAVGARALVAERGPATLANHCQRTYAFGALIGARDELDWDAELLYVAALLHDLGLTESSGASEPGFQFVSARLAREFTGACGFSPERTALVARSIELHLEVGRAPGERPEVALLQLGAAADVTGMRLEDIPTATVREVVESFPRLGFKAFFTERMQAEARLRPHSSTAFLCRWGQLTWRIKRAPFEE